MSEIQKCDAVIVFFGGTVESEKEKKNENKFLFLSYFFNFIHLLFVAPRAAVDRISDQGFFLEKEKKHFPSPTTQLEICARSSYNLVREMLILLLFWSSRTFFKSKFGVFWNLGESGMQLLKKMRRGSRGSKTFDFLSKYYQLFSTPTFFPTVPKMLFRTVLSDKNFQSKSTPKNCSSKLKSFRHIFS